MLYLRAKFQTPTDPGWGREMLWGGTTAVSLCLSQHSERTGSVRLALRWGWHSIIPARLEPGTHLRAALRGWVRRRRSKPRGALPSSPRWRRASQQSRSPDRKPVPSCPPRRLWCFPHSQTLLAEPWPKNRSGKPSRGTRTSAECQG